MTAEWKRVGEAEEDMIRHLIGFIGDNPDREGLKETPWRIIQSWKELFSGYYPDPQLENDYIQSLIKTFPNDGYSQLGNHEGSFNEMVIVKDIEFYSTCEHHMIPFYGSAHIGYIPGDKVIGVSKIPRILELYSRRLQLQERITKQVTEALMTYLNPIGCGCIIEARHLCMCARGIAKQSSIMVTSSLKGSFLEAPVRLEFLRLIGR